MFILVTRVCTVWVFRSASCWTVDGKFLQEGGVAGRMVTGRSVNAKETCTIVTVRALFFVLSFCLSVCSPAYNVVSVCLSVVRFTT